MGKRRSLEPFGSKRPWVRIPPLRPTQKPLLSTKAKGVSVFTSPMAYGIMILSQKKKEERLMILLVIDMQKALVDEDLYAFDTFVDSTVRLVDAARKKRS